MNKPAMKIREMYVEYLHMLEDFENVKPETWGDKEVSIFKGALLLGFEGMAEVIAGDDEEARAFMKIYGTVAERRYEEGH